MQLDLSYVHSTAMGYGRLGVKLAAELEKTGVKVNDEFGRDMANPSNVAIWVSTPAHARGWFTGQRTGIFTMWEACNLPESFVESLHNFDQVIVPSIHNEQLFSNFHHNVTRVPLGVDTDDWRFVERTPPTDRFNFVIGGSGTRKGVDLAYKAFRKLWPADGSWPREAPVPHLIFKSPKNSDYIGSRIEVIAGWIPGDREREVYAMAHCYLQPSRGEGWGLQPLQAIAQGCPTILTDAHGQAEFAHLGYGISAGYSKSAYFVYGDAGDWWEPDLDELCQYMEYVYNNYEEACGFARLSSAMAHQEFSWRRCAERFIEAVGPEHLEAPYSGDGSWFEPEAKLYRVRSKGPGVRRMDIGGTMYMFEPGVDYWLPADVKRIMFESNYLDPDCVSTMTEVGPQWFEQGLTPEQVSKANLYTVQNMHCVQCGQILNSGKLWEPEFDEDGNLVG